LLITHVVAVCRMEVTKHGEQDRSAKLRAVIRKGEPVSASLHKSQVVSLPEMVKPVRIGKKSADAPIRPVGVIADSA